jgi:hypothetical protein
MILWYSAMDTIEPMNEYRFYRYEEVEEKWLSPCALKPGTLCWVLRGRRSKKAKNNNNSQPQQQQQQQRNILFQRAVVVETTTTSQEEDDDDRILVRYPMGSTYHVRKMNLWPILQESSMVLCLPETLLYRRWAVACTQANDRFVEIGCDVGILVHRVHAHSNCPQYVWGLDTCRASIQQAERRFPECHFRQWRVPLLLDNDKVIGNNQGNDDNQLPIVESKRSTPPLPDDLFLDTNHDHNPQGNNLVVAVDINGNRELSVVQQCLQIVIQEWKPRLILVKSETLYQELARYK